jgi:hypothetical protein
LVETKTRDTCFGADVQKLRQDKWSVTHLATYVKCGDTREDTVSQVKALAECMMTYMSESVGEGVICSIRSRKHSVDRLSPVY